MLYFYKPRTSLASPCTHLYHKVTAALMIFFYLCYCIRSWDDWYFRLVSIRFYACCLTDFVCFVFIKFILIAYSWVAIRHIRQPPFFFQHPWVFAWLGHSIIIWITYWALGSMYLTTPNPEIAGLVPKSEIIVAVIIIILTSHRWCTLSVYVFYVNYSQELTIWVTLSL